MKKLTKTLSTLITAGALLFMAQSASAHIVGIGWTSNGDGTVTFDALHWHGSMSSSSNLGALTIDGTSYGFTSYTNNTNSMTGLDGALVNSTYSQWDGAGTLSIVAGSPAANDGGVVNDWLHLTVALSAGAHSLTADFGPGGLTSWTLDNGITTAGITTTAPEPISLALLGMGLLGLGFARKKSA